MTVNEFWNIIETAHQQADGETEAQMEALEAALEKREANELIEFQNFFDEAHTVSYRADLWGAGFLMNGGCSDDGFDYFRGWLIAQGRKVFEAALENPDSLADVVPEDAEADFEFENEDILNVARRIWETKTGLESEAFYAQTKTYRYDQAKLGDLELWSTDGDADEKKCPAIYPKLWVKFGW
jgi:Protein of unknown function (DUF4240)